MPGKIDANGLKLLICQRAEEVGEEGGGAESFESGHYILVVVPVVAKRGGEDKVLVEFCGFDELSLNVIMEGKERDVFVMEVGEEERGESPGSFTVMDMLDDLEAVGKLSFGIRLEIRGPGWCQVQGALRQCRHDTSGRPGSGEMHRHPRENRKWEGAWQPRQGRGGRRIGGCWGAMCGQEQGGLPQRQRNTPRQSPQ